MKAIKTIILIVGLTMLITACATTQLAPTATPEQKQAAMCQDAQTAVLLADAMLADTLSQESKTYWEKFKFGANLAIQTYCFFW